MSAPKAFIIGHPISHSRSPIIHRHWLDRYGIAGSYEAIDVPPDAVGDFIASLRGSDFSGGNVTIPHKQAVRDLCDEVEPLAARIGAVNTLVVRHGRVIGRNTDYLGFLFNLDAGAPDWDRRTRRALVLGAGGAARAVVVALLSRGIPDIAILNRTPERAYALAADMGDGVSGHPMSAFIGLAPDADLLINATAGGMGGTSFADQPLELLPGHALVADIVYAPLVTPLLAAARKIGLNTVDGLGMLLHQAVPGFAAWFGTTPSVDAALRAKVEATL